MERPANMFSQLACDIITFQKHLINPKAEVGSGKAYSHPSSHLVIVSAVTVI